METKPNLDYKTKTIYFNKISSKSMDFVLVDKSDCRIKLCIELDDSSHTTYYKDTLKKRIQENIKEHYYEN